MIADLTNSRCRLRITGEDRIDFLHGQCTNDIKQLRVGGDCYVAFLNAKGKMRGDGHVLRLPEELLLETSPGMQAVLEKFIVTEDVVIEVADSRQYLAFGETPAGLTYRHALGLGVITPAILPVTLGDAELEILRVEAGVPQFGVDMDETTIPVEAGLVSAISYEKGCYVGQETIARIRTYGHVNRHLVQLALTAPGRAISAGEKEVGQITSTAQSKRLGKLIALGYVRREFAVSGTKLNVGGQPAEVIKLCEV
ncbi:MAG: Aminomethyltransferase [Verrucomicrobiae bacterium]|nr:Aminomethyltransferase [Verrucomicrobiae bacterium]